MCKTLIHQFSVLLGSGNDSFNLIPTIICYTYYRKSVVQTAVKYTKMQSVSKVSFVVLYLHLYVYKNYH